MPNPTGQADGTALGRDDAVCRALRFLLMCEVGRWKMEAPDYTYERFIETAMSLYEELGGVTSEE
jgi:hypothetical protein